MTKPRKNWRYGSADSPALKQAKKALAPPAPVRETKAKPRQPRARKEMPGQRSVVDEVGTFHVGPTPPDESSTNE